MKRHQKNTIAHYIGFTLIELLIAVAIIGVLAKMAIPIYTRYMAKTTYQEAVMQLSTYKTFYQILILSQGYTAPPSDGANYQIICAWTNSWYDGQWLDNNTTDLYHMDDNTMYYGENTSEFCKNNRPPPPTDHGMFASTRLPVQMDNAEWELAHLVTPYGEEQITFFLTPGAQLPYDLRGGMYNPSNPAPYDSIFIKGVVQPNRQILWSISPKSGCKLHEGGPVC